MTRMTHITFVTLQVLVLSEKDAICPTDGVRQYVDSFLATDLGSDTSDPDAKALRPKQPGYRPTGPEPSAEPWRVPTKRQKARVRKLVLNGMDHGEFLGTKRMWPEIFEELDIIESMASRAD